MAGAPKAGTAAAAGGNAAAAAGLLSAFLGAAPNAGTEAVEGGYVADATGFVSLAGAAPKAGTAAAAGGNAAAAADLPSFLAGTPKAGTAVVAGGIVDVDAGFSEEVFPLGLPLTDLALEAALSAGCAERLLAAGFFPKAPRPETDDVPVTVFCDGAEDTLIDADDSSRTACEMLIEDAAGDAVLASVASNARASGTLPFALNWLSGVDFFAEVTRGERSCARRPARRCLIELAPPPALDRLPTERRTLGEADINGMGEPRTGDVPLAAAWLLLSMPSTTMRFSMASKRRAWAREIARCVSIVP